MSMHKIKLTEHEEEGLILHGLPIGSPSQLSDCFRNGFKWADHCAQAELETLRAENADLKLHKEYDQTLDQLIIERDRLLLENESLDDKLQDQLCTVGSLLEDNAKLIAERDALNSLFEQMRTHIADLTNEVDEYQAERESMMKQEPYSKMYSTDQYLECDKTKIPVAYYLPKTEMYHERVTLDERVARHWSSHMAVKIVELVPYQNQDPVFEYLERCDKPDYHLVYSLTNEKINNGDKLYAHPLPAQQVAVPDVNYIANKLMDAWKSAEPNSSVTKNITSYVSTFVDMARAVIALGMGERPLSASQPKGDV